MKGLLIAFEGLEGAGKTTQCGMLTEYIGRKGLEVVDTRWNSSELAHKAIKKAKESRIFTPRTYALMHAADFWDRHERVVEPALKRGAIVIADRWDWTALARDRARGFDSLKLYSGAQQPDLLFFIKATPALTLERKKGVPSYYEAGHDIGSTFPEYQGCVAHNYDEICGYSHPFKIEFLDGQSTVEENHRLVKLAIDELMEARNGGSK